MFLSIIAICLGVMAAIIMVAAIIQRTKSSSLAHRLYIIALMLTVASSVLFAIAMWEVQPLVPRVVSGFLGILGSGIIVIKLFGVAENYFVHTIEGWLIVSISQLLSFVCRHDFVLLGCWAIIFCSLLIIFSHLEWSRTKPKENLYERKRGCK